MSRIFILLCFISLLSCGWGQQIVNWLREDELADYIEKLLYEGKILRHNAGTLSRDVNIIIYGPSFSGKSSLINALTGSIQAKIGINQGGTTFYHEKYTAARINFYDTVGLNVGDSAISFLKKSHSEAVEDLMKLAIGLKDGVDLIIQVINGDPTQQDWENFKLFAEVLFKGSNVLFVYTKFEEGLYNMEYEKRLDVRSFENLLHDWAKKYKKERDCFVDIIPVGTLFKSNDQVKKAESFFTVEKFKNKLPTFLNKSPLKISLRSWFSSLFIFMYNKTFGILFDTAPFDQLLFEVFHKGAKLDEKKAKEKADELWRKWNNNEL
mmetsp:Transcript_26422/g.28816  ORF Transcript_26422/g.28816 Transcript_26422/m.28816 type:complete len:323 (-) Transcript_26422:155-1123(-)|eukprot:CAMPEP_0173136594 /NCGR_PEP_ID=MMETSP1105-20130129/2578_1 /TAXON_ID=2985 /ORGANISM="Ochromonas sp., Strain BG-1" /LENGTH=322 /DNA_ID=CAMNT_0014048809 /DNA_START=67 /DNA_END=1035 /DNA_ORIENTATION=+